MRRIVYRIHQSALLSTNENIPQVVCNRFPSTFPPPPDPPKQEREKQSSLNLSQPTIDGLLETDRPS